MGTKLIHTIFQTEMGWVGVVASDRGLKSVTFPQSSERAIQQLIGNEARQTGDSSVRLGNLAERLKSYFAGEEADFPDELELTDATPFQKKVWQQTRLIPYGETRSYLWVAERIGKPEAARAVGQALGRNPLPIIVPCHRVITSGGGLGGFGGGLAMKKRLLKLEGVSL
jgi:methylated-DNA-[protein]-cysteine S-methyltransferase